MQGLDWARLCKAWIEPMEKQGDNASGLSGLLADRSNSD